ncbi:tyrosinase family protein, partial [Salmonella enterica]|uniref:tyrosinase family protein n=4 Tax=cellular organisms TaxID=131567 RepID=UPI003298D6AF
YITDKDGKVINIMNDEGIDKLGDIIESSVYSPNAQYYGALHNLAHIMLGRQGDPHGKYNMPPGVMEHFETATRDPTFFRLHKYMDNIFKEHKDSLPPYTHEDLDFPGVDIESVGVEGELKTYFEHYEFDLRNAVDSAQGIEDVDLKAHVD